MANGRALGFARWDKLWAKPYPPPKFIFKIMFLHDFFGYLPLRQPTIQERPIASRYVLNTNILRLTYVPSDLTVLR